MIISVSMMQLEIQNRSDNSISINTVIMIQLGVVMREGRNKKVGMNREKEKYNHTITHQQIYFKE